MKETELKPCDRCAFYNEDRDNQPCCSCFGQNFEEEEMSQEKLLINNPKSNNSEDIRNKQIEEMARLMCANYDGDRGLCGDGAMCVHDCWAYREATHLHDLGYRKQSEIIKCKNCENCRAYTKWNGRNYLGCTRLAELCDGQIVEVSENDFCSFAKMKGGAE